LREHYILHNENNQKFQSSREVVLIVGRKHTTRSQNVIVYLHKDMIL